MAEESKNLIPQFQPKTSDGHDFPMDIYSPKELENVYIQKGKDTNNPVSRLDEERFSGVMDRVLGGISPREISVWYKTTYDEYLSFKAIQDYIDSYLPNEIKEQISLCTDLFKDAKVDEISMLGDLIKAQKQRITSAYQTAKKIMRNGDKFNFDFTGEFDLLYKMLAKSIELKQSMGLLPKVADKKEVKSASLKVNAKIDTGSAGLNSKQIARILDLAKKSEGAS